ncbi:hypothetical protein DFQ27_003764 [Actinomortierella ambigua]|uniref:pH-response regulator protein palC n=1 Tax=Actinomortierella ambigua TaxID=1343610 RepID=A0A9P6U5E1_9FUNG|nr:hypothetical protein DFQ27_003764 [Actinomortierella ambigua]
MVLGTGFPYALPTTGNVSFQELPMSSQHALHHFQKHLSNATAYRGRLRAALKEHKHSASKDYISIQRAVEDYIPYLLGLLSAVESGIIKSGEIETTWRCTLSNTILSSKQPRVKNKSIYYEAVFSFLTLGYVHMNRAREHVLRAQTVLFKATGDPSVSSSLDGSDSLGIGIGAGSGGTGGSSGTTNLGVSLSGGSGTATSIGSSSGGSGAGGGNDNDHHHHHHSSSSRKAAKLAGSSLVGDWIDHVRDEDMAQIDMALKTAAELYCRAAGVFSYIVDDLIPRWNAYQSSSGQAAAFVRSSPASASVGMAGALGTGGGASSLSSLPSSSPSPSPSSSLGLSIGNFGGVPMLTAGGELDSRLLGSVAHESSRPIDVQTLMVASHIRLALGEANSCTIQKASLSGARVRALERASGGSSGSNGRMTGTAGSATAGGGVGAGAGAGGSSGGGGKTSLSLLAKLSMGVKEEYEYAYGLIKAIKDLDEISSDFRNHAKDGKLYYEAMAQSFLGIDAYESGQYGKAVAFLTTAQATLASLAKSSKSPAISYAAHVEWHPVKDKAQSYQKINDSVAFESLTPRADLLRLMPSGRDMFKLKKYIPPAPAFGITAAQQTQDESAQKGSYALQGAYF